ncbi:MAG: hypothetical protein STHCBS139747_003643 [Sporothrix thermara]
MPPKASDYFLSDADNAAIFEQQIRPAEFGPQTENAADAANAADADSARPCTRPVCIILAGQTGAGKSHAAPALVAALKAVAATAASPSSSPLCHLVADTHKPYHPAYAGLVADAAAGRSPPGLASAATGRDARRWLARACEVAAAQQRPTLVESASRYPQDVVEMAATFRARGFRVCLVLLGVHPAQSRLGLLARYLDAAASAGGGDRQQVNAGDTSKRRRPAMPVRLTPRAIHDESYAGLATLADMLDRQGGSSPSENHENHPVFADAVLVLRRGNQVAYASDWQQATGTWTTGTWTQAAGVGRALASERSRRRRKTHETHGQDSSPLAREADLFASDVARLRLAHPERADELDELAAEYGATTEKDGGDGETAYYPLAPEALVAHLQSSEW